MRWNPLRETWERRKARAFPPGAVTFHLAAWDRGRLTADEAAAARRLMDTHGFSALFLLHGNALLVGGRTVLLVGPAGIGKSTESRNLVRREAATLIEDGLVVVGEGQAGWQAVETGAFGVLHRAARISALLRKLVPAADGPCRPPANRFGTGRTSPRRVIGNLAFKGGILLAPRSTVPLTPRLHAVSRVELFAHETPGFCSYRTDGWSLAPIESLGALVPAGISFRRHVPSGTFEHVRAEIARAVLDESDGEPVPRDVAASKARGRLSEQAAHRRPEHVGIAQDSRPTVKER